MDHVSVEILVDRRPEAAKAFQQEFGVKTVTSEVDQAFADADIDAVMICTHHDSHTPLALAAAAAGKHILLEKPMALTADECSQITRAAETAGVTLAVDYKFRFAPSVMKVKELIEKPLVTVGQLTGEITPDHSWTNDPVIGGGLILGHACHTLDMVYYLNGSEPVQVYAESIPEKPNDPSDIQGAVATLRFANGAIASLIMSEAGENPYMSKWFTEVFDGVRTAVFHHHYQQVEISGAEPTHVESSGDPHAIGTHAFMENFIHAIRTGSEPAITAKDGLRATLIANRIVDSLRSGAPEKIDIDQYLAKK
jgi:predicted dehydrogenase